MTQQTPKMVDYCLNLNIDRLDQLSITDSCNMCLHMSSQVLQFIGNLIGHVNSQEYLLTIRLRDRIQWYMNSTKQAYGRHENPHLITFGYLECRFTNQGFATNTIRRHWGLLFFYEIGLFGLLRLLNMTINHVFANLNAKLQYIAPGRRSEIIRLGEYNIKLMIQTLLEIINRIPVNRVYAINRRTEINSATIQLHLR